MSISSHFGYAEVGGIDTPCLARLSRFCLAHMDGTSALPAFFRLKRYRSLITFRDILLSPQNPQIYQ